MSQARPRPSAAPGRGAERREWERSPLVVSGEMLIRDEIYVSLSQNISGGGMFLMLPDVVALGDVVRLRFHLVGTAEHPSERVIDASAEVVWASQRRAMPGLRHLPVGIGVKFRDLSDDDRALILGYVQAALGQSP